MSAFTNIEKHIKNLLHKDYAAGLFLFICVVIALIWVNSPFREAYHHIWELKFSVGFSKLVIDEPLHFWINDGLMALFFFVIGLELKREFMEGELSSVQKASLPMIAALGGMLVPAAIYYFINKGLPSVSGWGVPMATDIAFAIGLLALVGNRIPLSVKIFLTALAVADDLGAVLVIAVFYTDQISFLHLALGLFFFVLLIFANRFGIRNTAFYALVGFFGVWIPLLFSGIHATIAGVLVAFTIPARTKIDELLYSNTLKKLIIRFDTEIPNAGSLTTPEQHHLISEIKLVSEDAETPLQRLEHYLHPWVSFFIMPVFALANAGVEIGADFFSQLNNPVSFGIIAGLVVGKFVGVFSFTWLSVKTKLVSLPEKSSWKHIAGVALLAGVGFTMSLFVTGLAFNDLQMVDQAKYGILFASFIAGLTGLVVLKSLK